MSSDFYVSFFRRKHGAIGSFSWGPRMIIRGTTADGAIDAARELQGPQWESAGTLCDLIQPGDENYVAT